MAGRRSGELGSCCSLIGCSLSTPVQKFAAKIFPAGLDLQEQSVLRVVFFARTILAKQVVRGRERLDLGGDFISGQGLHLGQESG